MNRTQRLTSAHAWHLLLVLCAVLPVGVSAVERFGDWRPQGDTAGVALQSRDVLTRHNPRVGMPTTLSTYVDDLAYHPGPAPFQAIAWHRLLPMSSSNAVLTAVSVCNALAIAAALTCARAIGGRWGMFLATIGLLALMCPFRGEFLIEPWTPYLAFLPFVASIVSVVALLAGRRWALPVFAVSASFAAQAHLGYVASVAGLVVFASAVALWRGFRRRPLHVSLSTTDVLLVIGTVLVVLAMWVPVISQQVGGSPGNISVLLRANGQEGGASVGIGSIRNLAINSLTMPPDWLLRYPSVGTSHRTPSLLQAAIAILTIIVAIVAAVRLRRRFVALPLLCGAAMSCLLFGGYVATRAPLASGLGLHNVLWIRPVAASLQVVALVGVGCWAAATFRWRSGRFAFSAALGLAVCCAIAIASTPSSMPLGAGRLSPAIASLSRQLASGPPFELRTQPGLDSFGIAAGLIFSSRDGQLLSEVSRGPYVGNHRVAPPGTPHLVVSVTRERPHLPDGVVVRAAYDPPDEALRRASAVHDDFLRYLHEHGPVELLDGATVERDELRRLVRTGGITPYLQLRAFRRPSIDDRWTHELLQLESSPIIYVRLYESP